MNVAGDGVVGKSPSRQLSTFGRILFDSHIRRYLLLVLDCATIIKSNGFFFMFFTDSTT